MEWASVVDITDVQGRLVRRMDLSAQRVWDLADASGRKVAPGVYLLRTPAGALSRLIITR